MTDIVPRHNSRAIEKERAAQKAIIFKVIESEGSANLVEHRQACSDNNVYNSNKVMEARGKPMPLAHEECAHVLEVTGRKGWESDLYINLALQAQGMSEWRNEVHNKLLANGEAETTFLNIARAARAGEKFYKTIRDDTYPLECPLAFDVGFTYGVNPDGSKPTRNPATGEPYAPLSPETISAVAQACYKPGSPDTIGLEGVGTPLNTAAFRAGESWGRALRAELDAKAAAPAAHPATPEAPAASKPTKASARGKVSQR